MARKKADEARDAAESREDTSAVLTEDRSDDTPADAGDAVSHDTDTDDREVADGVETVETDDTAEVEDTEAVATEVEDADEDEDDETVDDTDDELDDSDREVRTGPSRVAFFATLGVAVVALIGVLFLLGAYVWPAFLGPGAPEDAGNKAVAALGAKDPSQLQQLSCIRLDGAPSASFPPELLALISKAAPAGPVKQTLDTETRVPVDLTLSQGGQSQTLPADLLLGVNHGDWCLNGISQRQ